MNHNLTIGHMDTTSVAERSRRVLRPLDARTVERHLAALGDRDGDGWMLGGEPVEFRNGCVIASWMVGGGINRAAEEFALRMIRDPGCQVIDRSHGRIIEAGQLEGLALKEAAAGLGLVS
jgi:hypothetical protein